MTTSTRFALVLSILALASASPAAAQTLEEEQAASDGSTPADGSADALGSGAAVTTVESDHTLGDEQASIEDETPTEEHDDGINPRERPNTDYFSLGFLARGVAIPDFIQNIMVYYRGGTPVNAGMGGYFNWRRNGFNVIAEVWYLGMQNEGYYHGIGAADQEIEQVQSRLGVVMGNFVFGWAFDVTDWFAVELGLGLGFGGVVGDLYRQEAHPNGGGGYAPCTGIGMPDASYCEGPLETRNPSTGRLDDSRMHGGTYQQLGGPNNGASPFYFGDGGIPPMFFWIDLPRVSVRFRPIRQIQIRLDLSYNLYGFGFGGSVGYGF